MKRSSLRWSSQTSGRNILQHLRQSAVLIYGFPCHCSVISRAVSNLKCNCQRQAYAQGYTAYSQGYRGIWVDKIPCPWHTRRFMPGDHIAAEDKTTHVSFTISFHVYAQRAFPCRTWQGTVPRVATAFGHTSQCHTDLTTQHVYPTVKVTKQVQDMHVARTVIAERGPACACRQRMAVSFPSLSFVSSLAFGERKSRGWTMCSALFRGGLHNEFFLPGSRKSMCSSGQIFKNGTLHPL